MSESQDVSELLKAREPVYGDAWLLAGRIVGLVAPQFYTFILEAPEYAHNWVIIVSKLMRILASPRDPEHWRDIAGYATLCMRHAELRRAGATIPGVNGPTKDRRT